MHSRTGDQRHKISQSSGECTKTSGKEADVDRQLVKRGDTTRVKVFVRLFFILDPRTDTDTLSTVTNYMTHGGNSAHTSKQKFLLLSRSVFKLCAPGQELEVFVGGVGWVEWRLAH